MKILVYLEKSDVRGGIEIFAERHVARLRAEGHEVDVASDIRQEMGRYDEIIVHRCSDVATLEKFPPEKIVVESPKIESLRVGIGSDRVADSTPTLNDPNPTLNDPNHAFVDLLYVGQLLLAAMARMKTPRMLDIVGTGNMEPKLKALAEGLGIADRVRFNGFQSNPQDWMRAALEGFRGRWLTEEEMKRHGIWREDRKFGDAIFLAEAGVQFAPSDMGVKPLNGMHGFDPDDEDSLACWLSTVPVPDGVTRVCDYFSVMVR